MMLLWRISEKIGAYRVDRWRGGILNFSITIVKIDRHRCTKVDIDAATDISGHYAACIPEVEIVASGITSTLKSLSPFSFLEDQGHPTRRSLGREPFQQENLEETATVSTRSTCPPCFPSPSFQETRSQEAVLASMPLWGLHRPDCTSSQVTWHNRTSLDWPVIQSIATAQLSWGR